MSVRGCAACGGEKRRALVYSLTKGPQVLLRLPGGRLTPMERKPLDDADLSQWTVRRPADPACAAGDGRARKTSVTGSGRKWDSGRADHRGDQVRRRHSWSSMRHVVTQQPQIACWNSSQARQISGPGRSTQVARRSLDAALKRDEQRIAFRMRCSRSKQATT